MQDDNTEFYRNQADLPAQQQTFTEDDRKAIALSQQIDVAERTPDHKSFEQREVELNNAYALSEGMLRAAVERYQDNRQHGLDDALSKAQIQNLQNTITDLKKQRQQLELDRRTAQQNNPTPPPLPMNPPYPQQPYPVQQPQQPYPVQQTPPNPFAPYQQQPIPAVYPPQQTQSDFMIQMMFQDFQAIKMQLAEIIKNTTPVKTPKPRPKRVDNSAE